LFDGGEVSGFIDFDLSEINVRLWDVCYCATGILSESSSEAYEITVTTTYNLTSLQLFLFSVFK